MNEVRLGEVAEKIGSGATPRGGERVYRSSGTPFIRSQNIHNDGFKAEGLVFIDAEHAQELDHVSVLPGDNLLAITGESVARTCLAPRTLNLARVSQHVAIIRVNQGSLDSRFLHYALVSPRLQGELLSLASAGATRQALTKAMLENLRVPCPPLTYQRAIASTLGSLDDKIELNRRMDQTLEQVARALFRSWFIDFDPVRAKAERTWKKGESLPGMPADMRDLWPSEFEESEVGDIPKGWAVLPLSKVASIARGVSYRSADLRESDTALVSLKCAGRDGTYHADGLKAYRGKFKSDQVVEPGEVVVSHTDVTQLAEVIGRAYRVRPSSKFTRLVASLDMAVVRPSAQGQTNEYLARALSADRFRDHTFSYTNGTTVLHLSPEALPAYPYLVPPPELVGMFSRIASPMNGMLDGNDLESVSLTATRDTLLPKLLSGEVRVPVNGGA